MSASIRANILAESWSRISNEYERILVPRFAPWTRDALDALRDAMKNEDATTTTTPRARGRKRSPNALVLCCGPGQELLPIARILSPTSRVLGTDLAPGMVDAARRRIEDELEGGDEHDDGTYIVSASWNLLSVNLAKNASVFNFR